MQIAGIKLNDTANCPGIGISIYVQYCPHHCKGCFNPETWSKDGGETWDNAELATYIKSHLHDNGIKRGISLLGGEPLCPENCEDELYLVKEIKQFSPDTKIYIWTGYTIEVLYARANTESALAEILSLADYIIDGPYVDNLRDITLRMRGSSNQRIWKRENNEWKSE